MKRSQNKKNLLKIDAFLASLPDLKQPDDCVISILSGGLDSTLLTYLLLEKYGPKRVRCLSFAYRQKQAYELEMAKKTSSYLGLSHKILEIPALAELSREVSANISGSQLKMPSIKEVLGDPQPVTYVPFRNMILASFSFSYAEAHKAPFIFMGLQVHDVYNYWDTSPSFISAVNQVSQENRKNSIKLVCPFASLSKSEELSLGLELEQKRSSLLGTSQEKAWNFVRLGDSLTCYEPVFVKLEGAKNKQIVSCGFCPSCSERIMAFAKLGLVDPILYQREIAWDDLITEV